MNFKKSHLGTITLPQRFITVNMKYRQGIHVAYCNKPENADFLTTAPLHIRMMVSVFFLVLTEYE